MRRACRRPLGVEPMGVTFSVLLKRSWPVHYTGSGCKCMGCGKEIKKGLHIWHANPDQRLRGLYHSIHCLVASQ